MTANQVKSFVSLCAAECEQVHKSLRPPNLSVRIEWASFNGVVAVFPKDTKG